MRKNSLRIFITILVFSTLSISTLHAISYKYIYEAGLGYGGETLVKDSSNGNAIIRMGDGLMYGFGIEMKTIEKRDDLYTTLSVDWLADWVDLFSGGLLSRVPLNLTQYYSINQWQIGAGITYHIANKFYADEDTNLFDIKFDNALGATLSIAYDFYGIQNYMGLRATFIQYQAQDNHFPSELSGNSISFFMKSSF